MPEKPKTRRRPRRNLSERPRPRREREKTPRQARAPEGPPAFTLDIAPKVAKALERIGVPEDAPFVPDQFQLEAVRQSGLGDVIVSAPTGSGKTWIAEQAMARQMEAGGRCWYASPLKALSNAKFLEFGRLFGPDRVGLLTGDHKVNTDAPLIIGTTEILRNQLYDAMSGGRDLATDLVVADEAHYLGDKDRGVVWEEVLIYLPARIKLLLLSATVANSAELAAWLARNRGREVAVISGSERPVPLVGLCLWPSGKLVDLSSAAAWRERRREPRRSVFQIQMPNSRVMTALRDLDLLPAIFFLKSRADCDLALGQSGGPPRETEERFLSRQALIDEYLDKYPFLADHAHLGRVRRLAVAAHHAGHLPHYKLLVEDLMSRGLLDAIFATSTVSAGVNFPARTVVIRQSDRFDGQSFSDLTANEFTQMTGRAGRRGRDNIGFALMVPGPHMDLGLMAGLFNSPPDPVESGLAINFSMVLNLLNSFRPNEVRRLLSASLAAWQKAEARDERLTAQNLAGASDDLYQSFQRHMEFLKQEGLVDAKNHLTPDGRWATELRLDHPLVFYAGIKNEAWPLSPPILAAAVAGLVSDKESNKPPPRRKPPKKLTGPLQSLVMATGPMMDRLEEAGFSAPVFNLRPAWAMWSWAVNGNFDEAVELLGLGAGDMAMLTLRCADHLRQMAGLKTHEALTRAAKEAIYRILKEPVSSPL
ncbi:DEAD/DEAH box helicase [Deltaproteobacteria bacterium OttesenSCG-928-M10]|nr:DEAD/DEAH box helicase [Deltaproteobacteria bacterium OttesenSCG-928-M10]